MREWCNQHPLLLLLLFIIIIAIYKININVTVIIEGKNRFMKNFSVKGGVKMPNKNNNGNNGEKRSINDSGSKCVPPSQSSAPPKPPKQK